MAARKKAKPKPKRPEGHAGLYLLCFNFVVAGNEMAEGTFQLVAQAKDPEDALDRAADRLRALRDSTDLFDCPISIYLAGGVLLKGQFETPLLVNWEQQVGAANLSCLTPKQGDHADDNSFEWKPDRSKDGADVPFLDFGGLAFQKALNEALRDRKGNAGSPALRFQSAPSTTELIKPTIPRTKPRDPEPTKHERRAAKERRAALNKTNAELRSRPEVEKR